MASKTAVTEFRRAIRRKNAGAANKKARRNKGTTPAFPIHTPEIDAAAPKAQVAQPKAVAAPAAKSEKPAKAEKPAKVAKPKAPKADKPAKAVAAADKAEKPAKAEKASKAKAAKADGQRDSVRSGEAAGTESTTGAPKAAKKKGK